MFLPPSIVARWRGLRSLVITLRAEEGRGGLDARKLKTGEPGGVDSSWRGGRGAALAGRTRSGGSGVSAYSATQMKAVLMNHGLGGRTGTM